MILEMLRVRARNGPEYEARRKRPFAPPKATLKEIRDAVPKDLLRPNSWAATYYVVRDLTLAFLLWRFALSIDTICNYLPKFHTFGDIVLGSEYLRRATAWIVKAVLWGVYWWFQGLVWAGIFCLGHDAGHGTLYPSSAVNNTIGFVLHTFLLIPYFAWRATHHAHHKATGSMERDENYVPYTRSEYALPDKKLAHQADYAEIFEETPIATLGRVMIMQGFGWWVYLSRNTMGSKMYPPGTNHFDPDSPLFRKDQRNSIIISNIGLACMVSLLCYFGPHAVGKYYLVPYLLTNHWIVMFTYLHHSDPTIPHYRKDAWTFLRGAAATVDRPLLGWMGRFFLHNISHDHVAHHFFSNAPFYNGPKITERVKKVLGEDYNYDSTPTWYALWRSFTECLFVEEDESVVFYRNRRGEAARVVENADQERVLVDSK
ncbi:hypothetical protein HGRIS_000396 [Hohenbuehelia grisea]|uniref:Fatty acid desaturase domain-containing protein n=1 Tax=Hohenbuehelia grisea TaxID=104357 RepID=A0ABR3JST4_9AGAR